MSENELLEKHALTAAQMKIMGVIWNMQPDTCTPTEIWRQVNEQEQNNYNRTTVSTFLRQLVQKGYLEKRATCGRCVLYTTTIDKKSYTKKQIKKLCQWYDKDIQPKKVLEMIM